MTDPYTQDHRELAKQQQLVMGPIPLPTELLAEVFGFLSRLERAQLALGSRQMAEAIVPGVNFERKKVNPTSCPSLLSPHQ